MAENQPPPPVIGDAIANSHAEEIAKAADPTKIEVSPEHSDEAEVTIKFTHGTMSEIKQKAPKVYKAMLLGITTNLMRSAQRSNRRIVEIIRKGKHNNG